MAPPAATAAEVVAEAMSEHANSALLLLSAARSVLGSDAPITSVEQTGAAIGAVRTGESGLLIGGRGDADRADLLRSAAEILASGATPGGHGPAVCLPHTAAVSVAASARMPSSAWTTATVAEGRLRPDPGRVVPAAEVATWILDVATTSSLARRQVPIFVDANGSLLSLSGPDEQETARSAALLNGLIRMLVANGNPAALPVKPNNEVWPFDAHARTWARAGVLRSSLEAACEAFLRTSRSLRLTQAAAMAADTSPFVGVNPRGMVEEVYEGAAFGWIWASAVLSSTPDSDFVHACGAVIEGSWGASTADAAATAIRGWLTDAGCTDLFDEDLAEVRRMLVHVAQHTSGVSHICDD